jgi:hypothetical protein
MQVSVVNVRKVFLGLVVVVSMSACMTSDQRRRWEYLENACERMSSAGHSRGAFKESPSRDCCQAIEDSCLAEGISREKCDELALDHGIDCSQKEVPTYEAIPGLKRR